MDLEVLLAKFTEAMDKVGGDVSQTRDTVVALDTRITTIEDAIKERSISVPGLKEELDEKPFSFQRAIRGISTGDWKGCEHERDVMAATREKALSQGTDTAGGFLVPPEVVTELIELLRSKLVLRALGAVIMDGLVSSPVEIPRQTGGATGAWIAEGSAITDSDQTFGQVTMTPHQASALTKMSNRLLRMSNPAAEAIIRNDLIQVIARLMDLAGLRGSGASNQPLGVANVTGIGTVAMGTNGAAFVDFDKLHDLVNEVEVDDVDLTSPGFIMHPKSWNQIRKLKDADTRYQLEPDAELRPLRGTIIGYPFATTTQLPTNLTKGTGTGLTEIFFGNWSDLILGMWGGLELAATTQAGDAFEKNQTWVRIIQETDVAVRHAESFALISDLEI